MAILIGGNAAGGFTMFNDIRGTLTESNMRYVGAVLTIGERHVPVFLPEGMTHEQALDELLIGYAEGARRRRKPVEAE